MRRILFACTLGFISLASFWVMASQSYLPPPPPKLPAMLSTERVETGKRLFLENIYVDGKLEIYNFLGKTPCGSCHDQKHVLKAKPLAKKYKYLRKTINQEITKRMGGEPLPLEGRAMDSLVQYMVQRYRLFDYKLSK